MAFPTEAQFLKALIKAEKLFAKEVLSEVLKAFDKESGYKQSFDGEGEPTGVLEKWKPLGTTKDSRKYVNRSFSKGGRSGQFKPVLKRTGKLRNSIFIKENPQGFEIMVRSDRNNISKWNSDRPHINEPGFMYKDGGRLDKLYEKSFEEMLDKIEFGNPY